MTDTEHRSSSDAELPGSADERTELAWSRSALAAAVTAAAILRREWADSGETTLRRIVVAVLLGAVLAWTALVFWKPSGEHPGLARQKALRRVAVASTLLAVAALALVIAPDLK